MKNSYLKMAMQLRGPFAAAARQRRMAEFIRLMRLKGGERIIDLGGDPRFWDDCPTPLDITVVNLPGINPPEAPPSHHAITLVDGDACAVDFAADMSFDIAFSNSVIEHVGDADKRAAFAGEVLRLAPAWWVQTPSIWFPIEAHCHMPFWWFYPERTRAAFIRRWHRELPAWTDMVATTTIVRRSELETLFPDSTIWREWKLGFLKSYVTYRPPASADQPRKAS
ncbi:class I SAM-dependent methyltransferase [Rhodosalinus halophilus]|uniref:Class I SAM-dependent methyltransferase n=1 Tax=Rhodosalinus halophilus TaxID=2259333 RepID=A0A365U9F6_9RHOB|nr:class I SAM-dependent methyltransferase [Rhodosalinus halophilus]RBI85672.1 class I SAM-dependent methyltransferase [Rhodosalinus halophilus]